MINFMPANYVCYSKYNENIRVYSGEILNVTQKLMSKFGFNIDEEKNVYIMEGYGALICNLPTDKESINSFINMLDNKNYSLTLGPGAPSLNGMVYSKGLYCKNYKEIYE